jgi:condensin-2 complex subunit G2
MSHLYEPVVFRYLHAANPIVRLNALSMFVSAFPLESPEFSDRRKTELRDAQIDELRQMLLDESPKIRAQAAKAVCRVMYEWWELIPPLSRSEFVEVITEKLCFDGSSSSVRIAALEGLRFLTGRFESVDLIVPKVGGIGYLLHDSVEGVRAEFVKLLAALSPLNGVNIFELIHIDHLIFRLKDESQKCAMAVCELLQPSLFPPPTDHGKEKAVNTRRVSRCIFLMKRNLDAAIRFYQFLPKAVSMDEILCFLRFAYFWVEKTVKGQKVTLPLMQLAVSEGLALPAFEDVDDLEKRGLVPHQAIWAVIASSMKAVATRKLDEQQLEEVFTKTFPHFDAKSVISTLSPSLHQYLFQFISIFRPRDADVAMALDYLQSEDNPAWADALKCLVEWKALTTFFPGLVDQICQTTQGNSSDNPSQLTRAINYVAFIFSNSELRSCILDDLESIRRLSDGLHEFLMMLLIKLNISFEELDSLDDRYVETADTLSDNCYCQALHLMVTVRVHLALHLLQLGDDASFFCSVAQMSASIFVPVTKGILAAYAKESLEPPNLCYMVLEVLFTLISDMLSLHVFDGDVFQELVAILMDAMDTAGDYGNAIKDLAYQCFSKVVISVALDAVSDRGDHPAIELLVRIVTNADTEGSVRATRQLIENLVQQQQKKRNLPWLFEALSQLFAATEGPTEETKEDTDEDGYDQPDRNKSLHQVVREAILKLS